MLFMDLKKVSNGVPPGHSPLDFYLNDCVWFIDVKMLLPPENLISTIKKLGMVFGVFTISYPARSNRYNMQFF